ncbi:MAG TPA: alpha/beta hydrolase [Pseudonocardiaceae bacterium]|nr:alpha/beta hydrolase [Pseudonocardiaceae bacterium]
MPELELSAGTIDYQDTGGDGPVVVLLHGLAMDSSLWRHVVDDLRADHRCVLPTLPLGGHRRPMHPDADLTLHGIAGLVAEFLARLDLTNVTLAGNDWGGAQLLADNPRVARLALVACEAFDNYPPGLPGRMVKIAVSVPGGLFTLAKTLRLRPLRRLPIAFGMMSKRPVPNAVMDSWLRPLRTSRGVRRDVGKYGRSARKAQMVAATEHLRSFERPALVVWATEDRMMPPEHGRRLADLLPNSRLVEIEDSYTLIPEDQPVRLAAAIRDFIRETT